MGSCAIYIASPLLKRMVFQKDNRYGYLVVHLRPLDIIIVVYFQYKSFHISCLSKPREGLWHVYHG